MISQPQNGDQYKPVVNMETKIRISREAGNFGVGK
jgi:hypothetical protein